MNTANAKPQGARARPGLIVGGVVLALIVVLGVCEAMGWPFLASPMQKWLGNALQRNVSFAEQPGGEPEAKIHLLGGISFAAPYIEIGAPAWSQAPHMLLARDAYLKLGYFDLWRASRGEALRIKELRAASLDGQIERLADGRATWQFGKKTDTPDTSSQPAKVPVFDKLQVDAGTLKVRDALTVAQLDATYSLIDGSNISASGARLTGTTGGLVFNGTGTYQKQPLRIDLKTSGVLSVITEGSQAPALPVNLDARIGGARVVFNGTATDVVHFTALKGKFVVQGPSLAAVGDPLNVTLPSTPAFRAEGLIVKDGAVWKTVIDSAAIGSSRLNGAFTYDPTSGRPVLAGRLSGAKLALADLGPAVGTSPKAANASAGSASASSSASAVKTSTNAAGHVLPNREFDLPSLRAMDANVLIDIDNLDLGSTVLEPLRPLRTHLVLANGVLTLSELEARTGKGRLLGSLQLDGRGPQALWNADLHWDGVRLEQWVRQTRSNGAPPYASGNLTGQARVAGQGKSTAAILGSLRGEVRMQLTDGTVSHLAIEAAGLDVAQALGEFIKGDDSLALKCTVADLSVDQGTLRPKVFVLDTSDSTVVVDGSLSLASEALDLRVTTLPKDFSPLALRTPITLKGTFGNPSVSVEKGKLGARVGAAALLALVNPLAAIIPFFDKGSGDDVKRGVDACEALKQRIASRPGLPAPGPAKGVQKTMVGVMVRTTQKQ